MTNPHRLPSLAPSELEVMKVLWREPRLSAREIHQRLEPRQSWAYSTTRTLLERMVHKGALDKSSFHGIFLYTPKISKVAGVARLVREFTERVLELDRVSVVSLFAQSEALDDEELAELERLLEDYRDAEP